VWARSSTEATRGSLRSELTLEGGEEVVEVGEDGFDFGLGGGLRTLRGSHGGAEARRGEFGNGRKIWGRKIGTTNVTNGHEGVWARSSLKLRRVCYRKKCSLREG
jgi:hypothetical protein